MGILSNPKHEHFAQTLASGVSATAAYVKVYGPSGGAGQSAARLLKNAEICSRLLEIREAISANTIQLEISDRNARVKALQDRWDRLRRVIDERATSVEYADAPGGSTGLLAKDYKGKDATQPIYRVDTGLLAELRNHEKQAAQELGQWSEEKEPEGGDGKRFSGTLEELLVLYHKVQVSE